MAHGTPLGIADNDERYGAEGAFLIEAGISSSHHIASFFGLTERVSQPRNAEAFAKESVAKTNAAKPAAQPPVPVRTPDVAAVLQPLSTLQRTAKPKPQPKPRRGAIDVGAVITRALTAAGLMK